MRAILAAVALIPLTSGGIAYAHHSYAMFDADKTYSWTGVVTEYKWTNPHIHVVVTVPGSTPDKKLVGTWDFEGASPNIMARQGWSKARFKAGDKITVVGHPMKDGSKGGSLFYAVGSDGKKLYYNVDRSGRLNR